MESLAWHAHRRGAVSRVCIPVGGACVLIGATAAFKTLALGIANGQPWAVIVGEAASVLPYPVLLALPALVCVLGWVRWVEHALIFSHALRSTALLAVAVGVSPMADGVVSLLRHRHGVLLLELLMAITDQMDLRLMGVLHAYRQLGWMAILAAQLGSSVQTAVLHGCINWVALMALSSMLHMRNVHAWYRAAAVEDTARSHKRVAHALLDSPTSSQHGSSTMSSRSTIPHDFLSSMDNCTPGSATAAAAAAAAALTATASQSIPSSTSPPRSAAAHAAAAAPNTVPAAAHVQASLADPAPSHSPATQDSVEPARIAPGPQNTLPANANPGARGNGTDASTPHSPRTATSLHTIRAELARALGLAIASPPRTSPPTRLGTSAPQPAAPWTVEPLSMDSSVTDVTSVTGAQGLVHIERPGPAPGAGGGPHVDVALTRVRQLLAQQRSGVYVPRRRYKVGIKLSGAEPQQLGPGALTDLGKSITLADAQLVLVGATVRHGCIALTLDLMQLQPRADQAQEQDSSRDAKADAAAAAAVLASLSAVVNEWVAGQEAVSRQLEPGAPLLLQVDQQVQQLEWNQEQASYQLAPAPQLAGSTSQVFVTAAGAQLVLELPSTLPAVLQVDVDMYGVGVESTVTGWTSAAAPPDLRTSDVVTVVARCANMHLRTEVVHLPPSACSTTNRGMPCTLRVHVHCPDAPCFRSAVFRGAPLHLDVVHSNGLLLASQTLLLLPAGCSELTGEVRARIAARVEQVSRDELELADGQGAVSDWLYDMGVWLLASSSLSATAVQQERGAETQHLVVAAARSPASVLSSLSSEPGAAHMMKLGHDLLQHAVTAGCVRLAQQLMRGMVAAVSCNSQEAPLEALGRVLARAAVDAPRSLLHSAALSASWPMLDLVAGWYAAAAAGVGRDREPLLWAAWERLDVDGMTPLHLLAVQPRACRTVAQLCAHPLHGAAVAHVWRNVEGGMCAAPCHLAAATAVVPTTWMGAPHQVALIDVEADELPWSDGQDCWSSTISTGTCSGSCSGSGITSQPQGVSHRSGLAQAWSHSGYAPAPTNVGAAGPASSTATQGATTYLQWERKQLVPLVVAWALVAVAFIMVGALMAARHSMQQLLVDLPPLMLRGVPIVVVAGCAVKEWHHQDWVFLCAALLRAAGMLAMGWGYSAVPLIMRLMVAHQVDVLYAGLATEGLCVPPAAMGGSRRGLDLFVRGLSGVGYYSMYCVLGVSRPEVRACTVVALGLAISLCLAASCRKLFLRVQDQPVVSSKKYD